MILISKGWEETQRVAELISHLVRPGDVICLEGELGAGKTQFAKGFARGLGIKANITSPTFTLINEYGGSIPLYHIDAYRLEDPDEGYELGLEEYFFGQGVTLVEWPSKIKELLPTDYLQVIIDKDAQEDDYRRITLQGVGQRYNQYVQELKKECIS